MNRPLRWGVTGTGGITESFTRDLRLTTSGSVVAVGSRSSESARAFADRLGIANAHGSYQSLIEDPSVDAVYVGLPHPMHHPVAMQALVAAKPVLVEKPFTMTEREAQELVDTSRRRGVFLMEAMWTRWLPHMVEIRALVANGRLGEIVSVSADHGQWFDEDSESRLFAPELGGGALLDLGVYPVSFASMLLGEPERVVALSDSAFTGVDAQTSTLLGYVSGAHAVLTCTLSAVSPTWASVVGTDARIEIEGEFYAPTSFTVVERSGRRTRFDRPVDGVGLRFEADEVARCLESGWVESPTMPLDESVSIMRTLDTIRRTVTGGD